VYPRVSDVASVSVDRNVEDSLLAVIIYQMNADKVRVSEATIAALLHSRVVVFWVVRAYHHHHN
jgi:hypothetical protein